jgi:sulfite exporter TauE/SafE
MCGGFVCFYAAGSPGGRPNGLGGHAAYNAGRLVSYLTLGALAGALGAAFDRAGALAGVSRLAAIVAGSLMVAWGAATILALRGIRVPLPRAGGAVQRHFAGVLATLRGRPVAVRAAATGLLTTLLPCGWLYAFVATAGGSGSPVGGALVMLFFWAGTLPVMLTLGLGAQRLFGPMRRRLPLLTAGAVVVMGLLALTGHLYRSHGSLGSLGTAGALGAHADHGGR